VEQAKECGNDAWDMAIFDTSDTWYTADMDSALETEGV